MLEVILYKLLFVFVVIFITLMGNRVINKLCDLCYVKIAKRTKTKFDDEILPLVKRLLNIGIWAACGFIIATYFGVNVMSLYAGLGLSSIVTVMVVKESFINVLAGVTIMFDRPFKVGDKIKLASGDKGDILEIGLRRTKILIPFPGEKTGPESVLIIPNKDISKCKVYNYTLIKEMEDG